MLVNSLAHILVMKHKNKIILAAAITLMCSCGSHKKAVKDNKPLPPTTAASGEKKTKAENIDYDGPQWTVNASRPWKADKGLQGRHFTVWASHGRYFNIAKNEWEWQRPTLFSTNEDLFTQTIVVPYLMPMLENAGATVFSPRERDWQKNEVIVDNDDNNRTFYKENNIEQQWTDAAAEGFAGSPSATVYGGSNPFTWGTTRKAKATAGSSSCEIVYQPQIPESGRYAVYVAYPTIKKSVSDAHYTVCHKGEKTTFLVNQQMGGGTWVYLGTFEFEKGCSPRNSVTLTNESGDKGFVTADAVRFGGGMGNISRQGAVSGLPRALEGARYYAQWAGAPDSVYNSKAGTDDYKDDINVRSRMTNWLAGGSCYVPTHEGKNVPMELSLAVHSDAGYAQDGKSVYGSLSICTTNFNDGVLPSGLSRQWSKDFAQMLLQNLGNDMRQYCGTWATRELYDRNYSETRVPEVPSAIIETLSHQSFPDMKIEQDPNAKFILARSLYKTILRFTAKRHKKKCVVAPLAPNSPQLRFVDEGVAELAWNETPDEAEPTAKAKKYIVYTAAGSNGFDNGELVDGRKIRIRLSPDALYRFKVTAVNDGGESFPSETLAAVYHPGAAKTVLVVNGFHRLSAPAVRDNDTEQGFDLDEDPGVPYGLTAGWCGQQLCYDKTKAGKLGDGGLGFSGSELEGEFIMGNTFDYAAEHAKAIAQAKRYNVVSMSSYALEDNDTLNINRFACVDYILGLEKNSTWSVERYKTFTPAMQKRLLDFVDRGGSLLVSGAYVGSDMAADSEQRFLRNALHVEASGRTSSTTIDGMGTNFDIYSELNAKHYAATRVDILRPVAPAFSSLTYADGTSACVAWQGKSGRTIAMGFPFECIKSDAKKAVIMKALLNFLDWK